MGDARTLIGTLEKTTPRLCEHGATRCDSDRKGHGEPHIEFERHGFTCCKRCGYVKTGGGWRGTCIGAVKVELREPAAETTERTREKEDVT